MIAALLTLLNFGPSFIFSGRNSRFNPLAPRGVLYLVLHIGLCPLHMCVWVYVQEL